MQTVSVAHAKARLSEILAQIESGAEIVITRRGRPVARLSSIKGPGNRLISEPWICCFPGNECHESRVSG